MSQIFDALQRAEAAREGTETAVPLQAAEVLRRAERLAATKWETQTLLGNGDGLRAEDLGVVRDEVGLEFTNQAAGAPAPVDGTKTEERSRILAQFKTLPLSVSPDSRLVSVTDQDSASSEAFRLLGVRLRDLARTRSLKRVLITSTIPQEGKTTIAANLACTLARSTNQKILLLEGDVRRPALSQMLGLTGNPGICEWLRGDEKLTTCVYQIEGAGIWVMPAGTSP